MAIPLVETKLHVPRRRRTVVSRPRLTARLDGGADAALTLVCAPAGFGKTTLLAEWLAAAGDGRPVAWVSLDHRDDDPTLFWPYLVAALQRAAPDIVASTVDPQASPSADALVAELVNALDALPSGLVMVLDDYHVVDAPEIHEAMTSFVDHLPPQVRLVIATRSDPALPLARMRARGQLVEVRAADLRFTPDEAAAYLGDVMGLELAAADVGTLEARTEGWIAALQLAALSMQGRHDVAGFIAGFAGDDRFIVDYLVEEVLHRQTAHVRTFLLETSILRRLTGPLCDAVTGRSGGQAELEALDRANLFLVPLDDRRQWYRYHHLFADVLRARVLGDDPERVPELHRRASDWHAELGNDTEAVDHALAGRAFERAAELIELAAPELRRTRQEATLRRWLEALPDELFPDRPVLALTLVGARMGTGDTTGVEALVQGVERWLGPTGGSTAIVFDEEELARLPAQVAVYRAGLALLAGDIAGTIVQADRVLELAEPSDHYRRGAAQALLGLAHWTVGDLEPARRRYAESVRSFVELGFHPDVLGCSLALADIQIAQGRLRDAMRTFELGLELTTTHAGLRGAADMHVGISELLLERNDLDRAAEHLRTAAGLGEHAGLPQNAYRRRVALARLRQAEGDLDAALRLLDEAEPVYDTDFSPPVRPVHALRARVWLARGDVTAARRWARDRQLGPEDELDYLHEYEHVTLARTLLADGSVDEAVPLLERLLREARAGQRAGSVVEVLVLLALAHHALGDRDAALATLDEALLGAEEEGSVRVFLDAGPSAPALLQTASSQGAARRYARRVLAATRSRPATTAARPELVDELSQREREVLRLLRSDLSGPAIARELLVSLNTMRTHTKNIYAKLGVGSRREAVRKAAELGL